MVFPTKSQIFSKPLDKISHLNDMALFGIYTEKKAKMKPIVDEIARKLRDSLTDKIEDFEGLYVFGSQIRGDSTEDSDVDIVVLFGKHYYPSHKAYSETISNMLYEYHDILFIDALEYTREDLQKNFSFYDEVVNKGVFYGAI